MKKFNVEEFKKEIEKIDTKDLFEIITKEPLLSGDVSIESYTKEQRKILREKVLEIARLTLDLAELERKFIKEKVQNIKIKDKEILEILLSLI